MSISTEFLRLRDLEKIEINFIILFLKDSIFDEDKENDWIKSVMQETSFSTFLKVRKKGDPRKKPIRKKEIHKRGGGIFRKGRIM